MAIAAARPDGYGNSPYQPLSSFAGNELLVSPEDLIEDGLLCPEDCADSSFSTTAVDYAMVMPFKRRLLETAWGNFAAGKRADLRHAFDEFCEREAHWLDDYALFRALKVKWNGVDYLEWPAELVERSPLALSTARKELAEPIARVRFAQFLLPAGQSSQGVCEQQRLAPYRRLAVLRCRGFVRRVDRSWTVQAR